MRARAAWSPGRPARSAVYALHPCRIVECVIPTLLVVGAVAGLFRRGWLFVPVAAVGWPTILILGDVDSGVSFFIGAAAVGALNAAAGVAVGAGIRFVVRRLGRREEVDPPSVA